MNRSSDSSAMRAVSYPRLRRVLAAVSAWALVGNALANPTGSQTVAGQVSTVSSGNQLLITNSPGAILNWQSFSIMPGELTRFIQQSSTSSVLNRIVGQDPSKILGALQSNGKVLLINPNGIVFGGGAQVNVNGLVASSLNLSNADFLAGKLKFSATGSAGDVVNHGAITTPSGGQVYLIAPNVTNDGLITSPVGDVMLAAGQSVDLADSNDPDVRVVVSAPGNRALNVGKIVAASGRVGVYGTLVEQLGSVSANSAVAGENGKIVFKASGDAVLGQGSVTSATGGAGGDIEILGARVALTGNAVVDASGQSGGGTILIGGDEHGANAAIQNASFAYVGPSAQIKADAVQSGSGGKVVVWSDQQTQMYGDISARGGEQGGNGGFVETSGKNILDFQGLVDLRAPHGAAGTLLLDPTDITIDAGSSTSDVTLPGSAPFTITGTNATSTLSVADLEAELGLGNVTVATSSGATAPDAGNITVAAPVSWGNANSLTLAADHGININAPITAAAGTLVLTAASGDITQALGGSIPAAISVTSLSASAPAGVVSLAEPTNNVTGLVAGVGQQGFALVNSAGISVGTVGSVVGITSNGSVGLTATGGDITQSSSGGLIVAPAVAAVASVGSVDLEDPGNAIGVIAGSAYGTLGFTLVENTSFSVGTVPGVGGTASVTGITSSNPIPNASGVILQTSTAGDITIEAPVDAGSASVRVSALNGAVVQGSAGLITGGTLRLNAGTAGVGSSGAPLRTAVSTLATSSSDGAFYLSNTGDLTVNNVTAAGAVNINSGGSLNTGSAMACDCSARITAGSTVTLAAHDSITINAGFNVAAGDGAVTLYAGYDAASATYTNSTSTLTINEDVTGSSATPAPGGVSGTSVNMFSGGAISVTGAVTGAVTQTPLQFQTAQPPPTLDQCIATPTLPGCSAVLPTLDQCTSVPTTPGCSVVLPTLAQCTAIPSAPGCSVVLPTLAQCTATPTAAGCSAVLPSLAQCTETPTAPGCSVVLPTLAQCTTTPSAQGCSVVLPTLAECTATPTAPGCSVVLPTLAQCTAAPTAPGCSVVLPTLAQCTATPGAPGCAVVLPTLAACTVTPSALGCSVVLPTLATCTSNPTAPGCSVILPTLAQCTATPAAAGCSVVLPSLALCVAAPTAPGCGVVLPSIGQCAATPSLAGCSAVLPTLAQCTSTPAMAGCGAVLPTLAQCSANPALAGCGAVLPTLAQCTATPTSAGCSAVLPSLAQCVSTPTLQGCSVVLPPTDVCTLNPSAAGCQVLTPPTQAQNQNTPVSQALNTTVNIINTTAPNVVALANPGTPGPGAPVGGSSASGGSADSKSSDKKPVAATESKPGVTNDAAKKMYCN